MDRQTPHSVAAGSPAAAPFATGAPTLTLGELLRQARERRALTLDEIAHRTRIPRRHLEALEQNNLAGIPPGMYQRAEVRAYAAAVGLDMQLALVSLERAQNALTLAAAVPPPEPVPAPTRETLQGGRLSLITGVVLVLLVGAATFLWPRRGSDPVDVPATSPTQTVVPPAVESQPVPTSLGPGAGAIERTGGVAPAAGDATGSGEPPSSGQDGAAPKTFEYPDLHVITDPPGARVTVDGVGWGSSPLTIRVLPAGVRRLRVTLDGYTAQERSITLSRDAARTTVRITLRPIR